MLDDKKLEEIKKNTANLRNEGEITKKEDNKRLVQFYIDNSLLSLNTAKILDNISSGNDTKKQFDFIDDNFDSWLWVINTSYYSMFYMANAMLAKIGVKVKSEIGVHKKVFWAFVSYFYATKKIEKHFVELLEEAQQESYELLGMEKAKDMVEVYFSEMDKRSKFTYNIGEKAKGAKAKTSIARAKDFYNECLRIMDEI